MKQLRKIEAFSWMNKFSIMNNKFCYHWQYCKKQQINIYLILFQIVNFLIFFGQFTIKNYRFSCWKYMQVILFYKMNVFDSF